MQVRGYGLGKSLSNSVRKVYENVKATFRIIEGLNKRYIHYFKEYEADLSYRDV